MSDDAKLPDPMEALLSAWPVAHRPELDWEAFADATVTHAFADDHPVADDLLDAPSLEPEAGEPSKPRLAAVPSLDEELSLTDIAKASLEDDDPEETRELAQLAFSHAHRERVSRPSYPDVPRTSEIRATPRPPLPAEPRAEVVALESASKGPPRSSGGGRWGLAVAVLGIAAAAALLTLRPGSDAAPAAAPAAKIPTEIKSPATGGEKQAETALAAKSQSTAAAPSLTVEELAPEAPNAPGPKLAIAPSKAAPAPVSAPSAEAPAQEEPDDPRLTPASQADNVPLEPSTGAALAAVGRVMGGAKACVAGHAGPSNATITFGSDGKVQSVGISGPAAGTAAESCIRNALSGARVSPFAKPSFTVRVPIRP